MSRAEYMRRWRAKNPQRYTGRYAAREKVWRAANREQYNKAKRSYDRRHPEKKRAKQAVYAALRSGKLIKRPCEVCGGDITEAHHDDYSKPLSVRWLCKEHHEREHHPSPVLIPTVPNDLHP